MDADKARLDWLESYIKRQGRVLINDHGLPHGNLRDWIDQIALRTDVHTDCSSIERKP